MRNRLFLFSLSLLFVISASADLSAQQLTRNIKVISSAGARALVDACSAWAEKNKQVVAIAVIDWGGNVIESHAMEGAAANAIDTALLKAKSALRWRRPTSEVSDARLPSFYSPVWPRAVLAAPNNFGACFS